MKTTTPEEMRLPSGPDQHTDVRIIITLTAEPEVKRVRDATRDEWPYAVTDEIGSSNPWAWFCRGRRVEQ